MYVRARRGSDSFYMCSVPLVDRLPCEQTYVIATWKRKRQNAKTLTSGEKVSWLEGWQEAGVPASVNAHPVLSMARVVVVRGGGRGASTTAGETKGEESRKSTSEALFSSRRRLISNHRDTVAGRSAASAPPHLSLVYSGP